MIWSGRLLAIFGRNKIIRGITAIGFEPEGVAAVRVKRAPDRRPLVAFCEYRAFGGSTPDAVIGGLAHEHHLKRAYCSTILGNADYKLVMAEAPNVPPEELRAALRWKIKDLIDVPVTEVTLDVFDAPAANAVQNSRQVYVVAARNEALKRQVELLTGAAVNLQVIDIPELAQRNVAALLEQDKSGVALLSFREHGGLLTLTRQGELYLARNLGAGLEGLRNELERAATLEQIVLEIQRSLDFFESHFRQAPIRHVVLAPIRGDTGDLMAYLQNNLGVQVSVMDLNRLLEWRTAVSEDMQAQCYTALGAALREEGATV